MSRREFTFYVVSKDKQSENLIIYFYENMKAIKQRGFPKPTIYKLSRKEVLKVKEDLMNKGIRTLPSIKFNGNVYAKDELFSLLQTDLNRLKKKQKKHEEEDNDYYSNAADDYFAMMGMTGSSSKHGGGASGNVNGSHGHVKYTSDEEPLNEAALKEIMAKQEAKQRRPESQESSEIKGQTIKDESDSDLNEISEEDVPPPKSKKYKKKKKTMDYDDIDSYYADLALAGGAISDA